MRRLAVVIVLSLLGCAGPASSIDARLDEALPADVLLLGEQHDAPEHQRIHRQVIDQLVARDRLAAVVLEMASRNGSTRGLSHNATEAAVQAALQWDQTAWPWPRYAPAVMAAVRASIPVVGASLQNKELRSAMADVQWDTALPEGAFKAQQEAIRRGHCGLLPEAQIVPMTRVQIARDRTIAQTLAQWASPGKTVLLLAGAGHVDRRRGVPLHLPGSLRVRTVVLQAGNVDEASDSDATWSTSAPPPKDYCGSLRRVVPAP